MMRRDRPAVCSMRLLLRACVTTVAMLSHCMIGTVWAAQPADTCGVHASKGCITEAAHFAPGGTAIPGAIRQRVGNAIAARPVIGLALAGGGTRAAHVSMGVMKGLYEAKVLEHVDFLSTVSGGGYAGYWYVSQRLAGATHEELFRDCIPSRYAREAQRIAQRELLTCRADEPSSNPLCLCPSGNFSNVLQAGAGSKFSDPFRYQNHLRGHTDIFAPTFSYATTRKDERLLPSIALPIATQVATSLTVDLIGDMLFDWNLNASPSRYQYRQGLRRIYGLPPLDCAAFLNNQLLETRATRPRECDKTRSLVDQGDFQREPYPLPDFSDLRRELTQANPRVPYWIINATTPVLNCPKVSGSGPCVFKEFLSSNPYPPHKATFEFTPTHWGAGEFGYWPIDDKTKTFAAHTFPLLEAVASSAAFFDPHEKSFTLGGVLNVAQQSTGFKWGYYLPNPQVSTAARVLHRALVFPLYFAHRFRETRDAVDVHVIDGGQSDNLGAYGLIRRRVPHILLSDHATDATPGGMEDLCALRRSLRLEEFWQANGRKIWHIHFDGLAQLEQVCRDGPNPGGAKDERLVYNVWEWTHPVLEGCAVEIALDEYNPFAVDDALSCRALKEKHAPADASRYLNLFLIKPAINLAQFDLPALQQPDARDRAALEQASRIEMLGFLSENRHAYCKGTEIMLFPTHNTIDLTLDSSAWIYGAYRELAASAARQLKVDGNRLVLASQAPLPAMQPVPVSAMKRRATELTKAFEDRALQQ